MKKVNLAIVGVSGMVGNTFIKVLEEKNFPIENLYVFASARSAGKTLMYKECEYTIEELNENSFDRPIDIALFSAGGAVSEKYAPIAAKSGCVVIDNSSYWRMHEGVPLVVPEVNPEDVNKNKGIIANPNCSTIMAVVALKPLHDNFIINRLVYSTYQAVSGAGMDGYIDLEDGLKGNPPKKFPHQIAGNCIPHIDAFTESGYTKEEIKMIEETRKILHAPQLKITATTVRVPVFYGHSESINIEFDKKFDLSDVLKVLEAQKGLVIQNDNGQNIYPMPINAAGRDEIFVGRIRRDFSVENGLNIWVVGDNIRKGAATNAVQIAQLLI